MLSQITGDRRVTVAGGQMVTGTVVVSTCSPITSIILEKSYLVRLSTI